MAYSEDEYLMLSGIQHFSFCRRQWALIHVEQQWHENLLTADGRIIHERVHDPAFDEKRRDLLVIRGMNIHSAELGVSGQCDVVEFTRDDQTGIQLHGRKGLWHPCPVEYKRGKIKTSDADRLQLCCQAMCLEEMMSCKIDRGYLYYHEIRKREEVFFSDEMRITVRSMLDEMHQFMKKGYSPKPRKSKACDSCSLKNDCLPELEKHASAAKYIETNLRA